MTATAWLLAVALLAVAALLAYSARLRRQNQRLTYEVRRVLRAGADKVESQAEELRWRRALTEGSDAISVVARGDKRLHFLSPAARSLFGQFEPGEAAMHRLRHHILDELLDEARERGEGASRTVELSDRLYVARVAVAPAAPPYDWLFLFLNDVTELRTLARARRDMVANLSHELRTPLTSVKLMSETLLGGAIEQPALAARLVGRIAAENEALIRLVEDLTALSWIESGRTPIRLESAEVETLVRLRLARLVPLLDAKRVIAQVRGDAPRPIPLDPERFGQALTNILDNAIKFSPDDSRLTITLSQDDAATQIVIHDEGQGILPKDLPRIFERFYKGDRVRTRRVGGSGLGLAIAKHMVEAHGGAISVESEFGHGSTFTIAIPNE